MFDLDLFDSSSGNSQAHQNSESNQTIQCLTFLLGGETYGIDITHVKEIIEFSEYCTIPSVPDFFRGILDLRGRPVPVIDLGIRFSGQQLDVSKRSCIVIVELAMDNCTLEMGLIIDNVKEVIDFTQDAIDPPPSFGQRIDTKFMSGITKFEDKFIVLLDIQHVLPTESFDLINQQSQLMSNSSSSSNDEPVPPTLTTSH